jgi:hypothetical protein
MLPRFFSTLLLAVFLLDGIPLAMTPAARCSCPLKLSCCKGPVCPMELAKKNRRHSFDSCGQQRSEIVIPPFFRWIGLLPSDVAPLSRIEGTEVEGTLLAETSAGFLRPPERPPRLAVV